MQDSKPDTITPLLEMFLQPWFDSLNDPEGSQMAVLKRLLEEYAQTGYGKQNHANEVRTLEEYRRAFPVLTYDGYKGMIEEAKASMINPLLHEEILAWAITRGTVEGESKFIPMTPTDMRMRISAGRAVMNYVLRTKQPEILQGANINLNFPSVVGTIKTDDVELEYGYSSGIYLKHTTSSLIRSVPAQEEIDTLGGGKTIQDWERRFELAYQKARDEIITFIGGVAPTAVAFGSYLHSAHGVYPKDIWKTIKVLTLGSVPGINTKYVPRLRALYGPVDVVEIYGATEGMFGQQLDDNRAWAPNYDLFFFEVGIDDKVKMLYEMLPGETGSLIVSTPTLPRYKIGDLIRAYRPPYYRCIGRDKWTTPFRFLWDTLVMGELDRL